MVEGWVHAMPRNKYLYGRRFESGPPLKAIGKEGFVMLRKLKSRVGETRMMNCGKMATIIRYGDSTDIDVQFEDGAVATNKTYNSFRIGSIGYPEEKNRVGETKMMNCGQAATIIQYRNSLDIDVQFEDGYVSKNKQYAAFFRGELGNPNTWSRTGETRMMNCGQTATIIHYRNYHDMDVRFEDGHIAEHRTYGSFKLGSIKNPNIAKINSKFSL